MALILPKDKVEEQSTRLISAIVALYRKHNPNDHLLITEVDIKVLVCFVRRSFYWMILLQTSFNDFNLE